MPSEGKISYLFLQDTMNIAKSQKKEKTYAQYRCIQTETDEDHYIACIRLIKIYINIILYITIAPLLRYIFFHLKVNSTQLPKGRNYQRKIKMPIIITKPSIALPLYSNDVTTPIHEAHL